MSFVSQNNNNYGLRFSHIQFYAIKCRYSNINYEYVGKIVDVNKCERIFSLNLLFTKASNINVSTSDK